MGVTYTYKRIHNFCHGVYYIGDAQWHSAECMWVCQAVSLLTARIRETVPEDSPKLYDSLEEPRALWMLSLLCPWFIRFPSTFSAHNQQELFYAPKLHKNIKYI